MLRLTPDEAGTFKGWTLLTALDEIKGHEERLGRSRPQGKAYSRDFRGPNWLDLHKAAAKYAESPHGARGRSLPSHLIPSSDFGQANTRPGKHKALW